MSQHSSSVEAKAPPKTERGRRTLRRLLDAAASEFGARGFHETAITHITQRAGVGLGSALSSLSCTELIMYELA